MLSDARRLHAREVGTFGMCGHAAGQDGGGVAVGSGLEDRGRGAVTEQGRALRLREAAAGRRHLRGHDGHAAVATGDDQRGSDVRGGEEGQARRVDRKARDSGKAELTEREIIEQDMTHIRKLLDEIKGMKDDAESDVAKIHQHKEEAEKIVSDYQSGSSLIKDEKINDAVATVEQDTASDYLLRLRAEAVAASQEKKSSKAYALWSALTNLDADDHIAQFNAGYCAYELGDRAQADEKLRWLKLAGQHFEQVLRLKPDDHKAASNWGAALISEAIAIKANDAQHSRRLLDQAKQLLLVHEDAAPGVVAYNLACVYGVCGDVQACLKWLRVSQKHEKLPDCAHLRDDKDLEAVRNTPEFAEWFKQVCP